MIFKKTRYDPLFGIVAVPANLRLLGILLYSIAFIAIGIEMEKIKSLKE